MKKVSFRVRNFDKEQFLTYNIDNDASLDEEVLDFLEDEEPKGLVPIIFEEDEEYDTFSYNVTDKIRLCELSNQEINAEMVLKVMRGLILSLIDMGEYRVSLSYLVLHRNYIYINSDYEVEFICVPLEEMQEDVDLNMFLRNFVASLRFDSSENGDYVARLLSYINNIAVFNLRNMVTLIEDLMDAMGVEIPEDSSTDIYVDYQEVDEEDETSGETATLKEENVSNEEDEASDIVDEEEAVVEEAAIEEEETQEEAVVEEAAIEEEETQEEAVVEEAAIEEEAAQEEAVVEEETIEKEETQEEAVVEEVAIEEEETREEAVVEEAAIEEEETQEEAVVEQAERMEETPDEEELAEAKSIIDDLKKMVKQEKIEELVEEVRETPKKPSFKTKETSMASVVIEDDFEEFLAERERQEAAARREESGLKIKKNIKVNRASVVKSNQDEAKDTLNVDVAEEEVVSNSILSQTVGTTGILKGAEVPKANPYLIRVNTEERIMITKQNFKVGKASMGVDYTVKGNSAVSRVHAIITSKDDVYYVKDNKSTNHTFVNGKTLGEGESELLTHDCKIVLGDEEFVFKLR